VLPEINRKFLLLILTTLFFLPFALFAETGKITGRITDVADARPLDNTSITIVGTDLGASSSSNGKFEISNIPAGTYSLTFSRIGYLSLTRAEVVVSSAIPAIVNEELTAVKVELQSVNVSRGLFSRTLQAPPSTTILSGEEIRRYPGGFEDVVRTVAALPGVAVVVEGGRNDLMVRGGGPAENLYTINGIEVPNINHFGVQGSGSGALSFINLDFVNQVEFSAGGFGVEYGDKLSSVLDIDLRPGRSDRLGGRATMSASQFGIDAEGPIPGNGTAIISARKSYLDLIFKAAGLAFIPVYTDYNLAATWDFPTGDRLSLIGLMAIDRVDRDMSTEENRVSNAGIMDNTQDQMVFGGALRHLVHKGYIDVSVGVNGSNYNFSQADEHEIEYFRSEATETEVKFKLNRTRTDFFGGVLKSGMTFGTATIDNATSFADTIYDRSGNRIPLSTLGLPSTLSASDRFDRGAGFIEFRRDITPKLSGTAGVRNDYYGFINTKFYPSLRLRLNYQANSKLQLKGSVGRYRQAPSYVWVINPYNRDLKALKSNLILGGVEYLLREDLLFDVEIYHKTLTNLPAGATPETSYLILTNSGVGYGGRDDDFGSFGYRPLTSTGKGRAYGIEFQLQKRYTPAGYYGQAGLSLGRSRYTAPNGKTYPGQYEQALTFNLSAGYKPNPRWEYSGKFRFWTGSPYTPQYRPSDNNGKIVNLPEEYLSKRLAPGHHLDLRVDRRFDFRKLGMVVFLDIQNVYNNYLQVPPRYDFWKDEVDDRNGIALLPTIGIRAEF